MSYLTIDNFRAGLDRRRLPEASEVGSLQALKNAHINRGGEIEKAHAWVAQYILPSGTFGMLGVNSRITVFGSTASPAVPSGVTYQRLRGADSEAMTDITAMEGFSGGAYVVADYGGTQYHFYNGTIISDWYAGLVRASMINNAGIATAMAALIDADPLVSASSVGAVITITAVTLNLAFTISAVAINGGVIDDQTAAVATTTPASAGVAQISTVTIGGTFDPGDKFTVIINDNTYGAIGQTGQNVTSVITHKNKVYATSSVNLFFSGVAEPTRWTPQATGSGVIDMSAQASNEEDLTGLGIYQNNLAVFSRNTEQIWSMDPNPALNVQLQVLDNIGTKSPKGIISFGSSDVFFTSDFGIRSLRALTASLSAGVTDVGTPIDDIIIESLDSLSGSQVLKSTASIEPRSGRYVQSLGDVLYVFSYFPSSKISAWSTWEPGFGFSDFTNISGRLYGRAGDVIYLLGGINNDQYTAEQVLVELPYLDARTIATWKRWTGLDLIVQGQWDVYLNTNPLQPDEWEKTATIFETSIGQMKLAMQQKASLLKMKFVHRGTGPAKISKIIVHYEASREK